jgi:hypothetical protein
VTTGHALEETRHRLISTSNLHLEEGRLLAIAALVRTLRLGLLRVVPGSRSAKDVLALLALKDAPRKDRVGDGVFVRACAALEAVCAVERQGDGQDVCAVRTDCVARAFGQMGKRKQDIRVMCGIMCLQRSMAVAVTVLCMLYLNYPVPGARDRSTR